MATCFLFTHHLNEEGCLSLLLNDDGHLETSLEQRSFSAIKALQHHAKTIVVLPSELFSVQFIDLPRLNEKKTRSAIPFVLEDTLAQEIDTLHFAFSHNHSNKPNQTQVIVGDKTYLHHLINTLEQSIHFDALTIDWCALNSNEMVQMNHYWLINNPFFQGALTLDLISFYIRQTPKQTLFTFLDTASTEKPQNAEHVNATSASIELVQIQDTSYIWLAKRLQNKKYINLCQGPLRSKQKHLSTKRWYQAALFMSLIWLCSIVGVNTIKYCMLNRKITQVDAEIARHYHDFFPGSTSVINPRFRINQWIKNNQVKSDAPFWILLDNLAKILPNNTTVMDQLIYKNQKLNLTVIFQNFEALERLQIKLQQTHIKVKQTQASSRDGQAIASLELTL